jgi:hypothetical protein
MMLVEFAQYRSCLAALTVRKPEQVGRFRWLTDRGLALTGSLAVRERDPHKGVHGLGNASTKIEAIND